jgi:peptidylprolyl isomerase
VTKSEHRPPRRAAFCALAATALVAVLAGCGSGGSSTITVGNENKGDETLAKNYSASSSTTSTPSTTTPAATAKTPTTGPLAKEPTVTPPSGAAPSTLEVKDLIKGSGTEAKLGKSITVNYVGVLYHGGKQFDASWKHGEPTTFTLEPGKLIAGWTQGIPGMKVGGRRELVIPAALAYGARGTTGIPPNSPLVFVIDLLGTS